MIVRIFLAVISACSAHAYVLSLQIHCKNTRNVACPRKWQCNLNEPGDHGQTKLNDVDFGQRVTKSPQKSDFDLALERLGSSRKRFITLNLSAVVSSCIASLIPEC